MGRLNGFDCVFHHEKTDVRAILWLCAHGGAARCITHDEDLMLR
eukprot:XP_001708228.1 Hypothetical protein GL50803_34732 [Giardia lamblia ATCC 50803]